MTSDCPPEDQLLALAADENVADDLRAHVEQCAQCRMRVKLLRGEIAELRSLSAPPAANPAETMVVGETASTLPNAMSIGRYVIVGELGSGGQADVVGCERAATRLPAALRPFFRAMDFPGYVLLDE